MKSISQKNIDFFHKNKNYSQKISDIDTYKIIFSKINNLIKNSKNLLDIGHGGVFEYNTKNIKKITGLDLNRMISSKKLPKNIFLKIGSATKIPDHLGKFDTILMNMLLHHVVGSNVSENLNKLNICLRNSYNHLNKNGKLIIIESCVENWFYNLEKILYIPTKIIIDKLLKHPPVFQYTKEIIYQKIKENNFRKIKIKKINLGRYILQFGIRVPSYLAPVSVYMFLAKKI